MKKALSVILLITMVAAIFCLSAMAGETAKSNFSPYQSFSTSSVTAMSGTGAVKNSGYGYTKATLYANSYNLSNFPARRIDASFVGLATTSPYSNSPYTCTFWNYLEDSNQSGQMWVIYD